jgi:hypothetical protein
MEYVLYCILHPSSPVRSGYSNKFICEMKTNIHIDQQQAAVVTVITRIRGPCFPHRIVNGRITMAIAQKMHVPIIKVLPSDDKAILPVSQFSLFLVLLLLLLNLALHELWPLHELMPLHELAPKALSRAACSLEASGLGAATINAATALARVVPDSTFLSMLPSCGCGVRTPRRPGLVTSTVFQVRCAIQG